jgi:hypothetical protein
MQCSNIKELMVTTPTQQNSAKLSKTGVVAATDPIAGAHGSVGAPIAGERGRTISWLVRSRIEKNSVAVLENSK